MLENIDPYQKIDKKTYQRIKPELYQRLYNDQKASWNARIPVIIIIEGWHAAGKDAFIQRLTRPLDPRGFKLHSTQAANTFEKKFPWMWRFWPNLPARGEWGIFDRSWYSRVSDERVHQAIPEKEWRRAYRDIVEFERTLTDDNYYIFKFFLHISKQEQKRRYNKLMKDPLSPKRTTDEIWEQQRHFDEWLSAYEEIFERTETEWGAWTIVEATNRRYTLVKILKTIIISLENRLGWPYLPLPTTDTSETLPQDIEASVKIEGASLAEKNLKKKISDNSNQGAA